MDLEQHPGYFHQPYTKQYLTFLNPSKSTPENYPDPHHENPQMVISDGNINWISNVEIKPATLSPFLSFGLICPVQLLVATSAILIQIRTLDMLRHERSVNNPLMVTQAKLQILFWPTIVIASTLMDNIYPLSAILTPMFCFVLSFYFYFCIFSLTLYSFYAALLRYICCLHSKKVNHFGKEKVIRSMYWIFYTHTFLWASYTIFTSFNLDHLPLINNCYGYNERIFLMESTRLNMAQRHFCALGSNFGNKLKFFLN